MKTIVQTLLFYILITTGLMAGEGQFLNTNKSFLKYCLNFKNESDNIKHTVTLLREEVGLYECNNANKALEQLTTLDLSCSEIKDVSPLAGLTNIKELDLGYNEIVNISPLQNLHQLEKLNLESNPLDNYFKQINYNGEYEINTNTDIFYLLFLCHYDEFIKSSPY